MNLVSVQQREREHQSVINIALREMNHMGKNKRYKVVLKGFEIVEEGTGEKFCEAEPLTYHNMPYDNVCMMEKVLMGAFQTMNDIGSGAAAAPAAATSATAK